MAGRTRQEWLNILNRSREHKERMRKRFLEDNPVYRSGIIEKIQAKRDKKGTLSRLGIKVSEETRNRMRKSALKSWENNEKRKKHISKITKARRYNSFFPPSQDTSIELKIQNILKYNGIEFETHYPILGQPDIFIKPNICIFADGCYWHRCEKCRNGRFKGDRSRDLDITKQLQSQGYTVIRLWEHEINTNEYLSKLNHIIKS